MAGLSKAEISALSTQERLALIGELWESLETPLLEPSIEEAHRRIVEERLADYDPEQEQLRTLDEVCGLLRTR
jgi:putative addiction module component (TIGR02574 family)